MALAPDLQQAIKEYATRHIADAKWHQNYFDFVKDPQLAARLGIEFHTIRWIYKLLEGIGASDGLKVAQVRFQVFS